MTKQPQTERTVVCLMWGTKHYQPEWVNRLYRGVARHLQQPFRFVCFADNDKDIIPDIEVRDVQSLSFAPSLQYQWWKLALMHPDAGLSGQCLFVDLDSVIIGDMEPFFVHEGRFCIIRNWIEKRKQIFRRRPKVGNSSVFRFEAGAHPEVAERFLENPERACNQRFFRTEQAFMTHAIGLENITWWPEDWVRSFKYHCLAPFPVNWWRPPRLPDNGSVITFHGYPKPPEVIKGTAKHLRKRVLPMPDLQEHWI